MATLLPNVTEEMLSPGFWVSRPAHVTNQTTQRNEVQRAIVHHADSMHAVLDLWARCKHGTVDFPQPVHPLSPPPTLFNETGEAHSEQFWLHLADKIETATPAEPAPHPAFSICRSDVRRYPTDAKGFRTESDREFDTFQDSALHTFEPLLILFTTADQAWYYVISTTYSGWVKADHVALATSHQFEHWATFTADIGRQFVIPLANNIYTHAAPYDASISRRNLEFAAYLPLCEDDRNVGNQSGVGNYSVYLPTRTATGWLDVKRALVPQSAPLHLGFRPYSRQSVVESAFALLRERYGWGDSFGTHDCSSLLMDSYRTLGLFIPRDAHQQEAALPARIEIPSEATFAERNELLKSLHPGDPLYMPGHVMMYVGYRNDHHYVIHAFSGYAEHRGGALETVPVNEVMVSTLDLLTSRNRTYLEELTAAASLFVD